MALAGALVVTPAAAATSSPSDPFFAQGLQWALSGAGAGIDAPPAWCKSTGAGVLVADVDTGADLNHPDLAGKLVQGQRYTSGTGSPSPGGVQDDNGHGTMTAGIMVAGTNNGRGIAAVAPDARALVVKVLDSTGSGSEQDVIAGINYAAAYKGVRVINLSLGPQASLRGHQANALPEAIIAASKTYGVVFAIAAGNSAVAVSDTRTQQQLLGVALVVGALNPDGSVAAYSNTGSGVNLYAPGGAATSGNDPGTHVLSTALTTLSGTWAPGYNAESGTSFAAPQAAGVLALLVARGMSGQQAHDAVLSSARGAGTSTAMLDAARALGASGGCSATQAAPPPTPSSASTSISSSTSRSTTTVAGTGSTRTPGPTHSASAAAPPVAEALSPGESPGAAGSGAGAAGSGSGAAGSGSGAARAGVAAGKASTSPWAASAGVAVGVAVAGGAVAWVWRRRRRATRGQPAG